MKFLYASVEPNRSDELCAKVCSQILGVRQLGNEAESACIYGDELLYFFSPAGRGRLYVAL